MEQAADSVSALLSAICTHKSSLFGSTQLFATISAVVMKKRQRELAKTNASSDVLNEVNISSPSKEK